MEIDREVKIVIIINLIFLMVFSLEIGGLIKHSYQHKGCACPELKQEIESVSAQLNELKRRQGKVFEMLQEDEYRITDLIDETFGKEGDYENRICLKCHKEIRGVRCIK